MNALAERLDALPPPAGARVAWCVRDVDAGGALTLDGTDEFRIASLIKVPIALTVYRQADAGLLSLSERAPLRSILTQDDSGVLSRLSPEDATLSPRALVALMLCVSDNTASNLLIERVGMDAVNAELRRLGLGGIRLQRRLLDFAAAARGEENVGSALELATLMKQLARGELLSPESTSELLAMLRQNAMSVLRRELPRGTVSADKTGDLSGMRGSVGVLQSGERRAAVAVLMDGLQEDAAGERYTAAFGREVALWLREVRGE